nr:unnamed protein product [Callosobruchus chinensis]CAH7721428.1 unnamed protein product [Callosobruchus chinensis]CAH7737098.1 unnamed protein product [Callosobruchus chinensis]CAH7763837.1 unnamed protein product [Callosobruchus chinensis]CAH7765132.1 unnamed protein product [Callosobruchus chinensis]
MFLIKSIH